MSVLKLFNDTLSHLDLKLFSANQFLLWNFTKSEVISNVSLNKHRKDYENNYPGENLIKLDDDLNKKLLSNAKSLKTQKDFIIINFLDRDNLNPDNLKMNLLKLHIIKSLNIYNNTNSSVIPRPIITIVNKNTTTRKYTDESVEDTAYLNFFNSNIWNFLVQFNEIDPLQIKNNFARIVDKINRNNPLYKTTVAYEFIEFQSRMAVNSYLSKGKGAGHSMDVQPIYFHSEIEMEHSALGELKDVLKLKGLFWRVLLIDDYAEDYLTKLNKDKSDLTKKMIINSVISDYENIDSFIKINSVYDEKGDNKNIIWKALLKIAYNTYDIIFLDYLLGANDNSQNESREYSHELLIILDGILSEKDGYSYKSNFENIKRYIPTDQSLSNDQLYDIINEIKKNKCPLNRFWIMNISSFSTAFVDRLREQGLGHYNSNWYLSRGGDPVNTPHLFAYNLFRFMKLQIEDADIDTKEMINQFFDELNELEVDHHDLSLRDWASSYYQVFINRFGKFHILKQDRKKSRFSESFYQYLIKNKSGELEVYERFRNFLFLLANGTKQDFGQIMRSFNELSKIIEYEESHKKEENHNLMNKLKRQIIKEFPQ